MKKISRYFKDRVASLSRDGIDAYGKFSITIGIKDYIEKYSGWLVNGQLLEQEQESLAGRIMGKQKFKNYTVYDLRGGGGETIQLKVAARNVSAMKHGDIVGVTGFPARGNFGELIFNVEFLKVLAPCLHQMPDNLKQEARVRKRFLDLILHKDSQKIFETRAKIISYIRSFLDKLECQEVETPILNSIPGVGAGCPFSTNYKDLKLYLRVAPELNLKKLVVGGFGRVYEIGKQFRNEGIDPTHNPEFTSCEVYMTYTDYEDMMTLTEDLLSGLVKELTGSFIIRCQPDSLDKEPVIIDFSPPFRRMGFLEELEKVAGLSIPRDLDSAEANNYLKLACERLGVECKPPHRTARLLDKLIDNFLVPSCVNPTFIIDHPRVMSAMAKSHKSKPEVTERFELYVNKQELCNAYTELNDPMEQRQRFAVLLKELEAGDSDAQILDDNFCEALEYGLPPTAGWGIGIDRLVMLLTYTANIKDVLLFPLMRPVSSNRNSK